jgi:hypothetical protein
MGAGARILILILVVFVVYPVLANLSMLLFFGFWKLVIERLYPGVGKPGFELSLTVGLAVPVAVAACAGAVVARKRRGQKTGASAGGGPFTNDGNTEREQEVSETVSGWSHKEVRIHFAPIAENKTIDATVYVGEGGVPFHCRLLGVQSAREQANVILKALRDQK